jgi:hypothetical protein
MGKAYNRRIPDFDVISEDITKCANVIKEQLTEAGIRGVRTIYHKNTDDVIPEHIEVLIGRQRVLLIFKPLACYNYNEIQLGGHSIKVATMDTMLSFYLAFVYSGEAYFDSDRIMCMAQMLFDLEQDNRVNRKGLLKRFSANCYGEQPTLATIRAEKSDKFKEFKEKGVKRGSPEWNEWFFKYSPQEVGNSSKHRKNPATQKRRRVRRRRRTIRSLFF